MPYSEKLRCGNEALHGTLRLADNPSYYECESFPSSAMAIRVYWSWPAIGLVAIIKKLSSIIEISITRMHVANVRPTLRSISC